ncbi:hypothetical protein [Methylobacterium radiotolerans]|uniref:hypothetical protein n=1 Tax=Methylobacterium radiotolerans TaxID=31998 RepID=UPI00118FBCF0|nr:hypothetical protein [Methylobacterium radiotolerans]GEN00856.1 hypothetical protein MRA01_53950 [Methylobacterium radiotolerans]
MSPREFWNLMGRAGHIGHDSVGVVGLAEGTSRRELIEYVGRNTGALASRSVSLIDDLEARGRLNELQSIIYAPQWVDFRCYVAHLWAEKNLDAVLAKSEQLLRQTYGYATLRNDPSARSKADMLLDATQSYARNLAKNSGFADLADLTGFSPEGVREALKGLQNLEKKLTPSDWAPKGLFGKSGKMADLSGVMLQILQLKEELEKYSGECLENALLSIVNKDLIKSNALEEMSKK